MITDATGNVTRRYDYLPFGEGLGLDINGAGINGRSTKYMAYSAGAFPAGGDGETIKFTGKERDAETGIDYFGARYMSSPQGRFLSPDPFNIGADPIHPQSWNMYSYAVNNPLALIDPTGTTCVTLDDGTIGDNEDGQGCTDAGVAPGNPENPQTFAPPQEVDVNAREGSWWDYFWATTFNQIPIYVPNDVPLNPNAQIFAQELSKRIDNYPTVCGGGWYSYAGKEMEAGPVSGFAGAIVEHDSRAGSSKGALFEGGVGEGVVGGVGYVGSTSGGQPQGTGLAFLGFGAKMKALAASIGLVGFGSGGKIGGVGVYAEGFRSGRGGGVGAYVNVTNIGGCR